MSKLSQTRLAEFLKIKDTLVHGCYAQRATAKRLFKDGFYMELPTEALAPEYQTLLTQISDTYTAGRGRAMQTVNVELIETYWHIGQHIVEFEQQGKARADYGAELIKTLAKDLSLRHGKGFSRSNLIRIRQFYLAYPKGATASHFLSWSSHRYTQVMASDKSAVIPAGMPESSAMDGTWPLHRRLIE